MTFWRGRQWERELVCSWNSLATHLTQCVHKIEVVSSPYLNAPVLKDYPSKLLIFTNLQCLFSVIQTGVVAVVAERDRSKWKLGWDARLVAIVYSGFLTSAVGTNLQAWLIKKKGPVFQAMWTPLSLVITILFSTFLLGEVISLGSVLGGILLVGSLYCVLWGKSKEEKANSLNNQEILQVEVDQSR